MRLNRADRGRRALRLFCLALAAATLLTGSVSALAAAGYPSRPGLAQYRTLYRGLDPIGVALPPLRAAISLARVEASFPSGTGTSSSPGQGAGPDRLFIGFTLARLSCMDNYLAGITFGPGALVTVRVAQHRLLAGTACFELIGPMMYQVVELPVSQFLTDLHLEIQVARPHSSGAADRAYVQLTKRR